MWYFHICLFLMLFLWLISLGNLISYRKFNFLVFKKKKIFLNKSLPSNLRNRARGRENQYFALFWSFKQKFWNFLVSSIWCWSNTCWHQISEFCDIAFDLSVKKEKNDQKGLKRNFVLCGSISRKLAVRSGWNLTCFSMRAIQRGTTRPHPTTLS